MKIDPTTEIRSSSGPTNLRAGMEALSVFARDAEELELALHQLEQVSSRESRKPVQRLKKELAAFEPSITVLGQVKAGKTALINAMAGWADLLPSDVNPWTSVVTSLHLNPAEDRAETGAKFQFMTEDEWDRLTTKGGRLGELADRAGAEGELNKIQDQIDEMREKSRARLGRHFELLMGQEHEYSYFDKNLLERYICLGDDFDMDAPGAPIDEQGRFADITRAAELYLNCQTVPHRLCIRDTPGVNDTFMMREMVTIKAVRESRICVVVLSATQALTSVDMALIRMITNLKSREVIIFVNRVDELSDPDNQIVEVEKSIRETLKAHHGPENAEIIFGSAYWANKVLSGELDGMQDNSVDALLSLTEAVMGSTMIDRPANELVWEMSGLPRLMRALSGQIVTTLGTPLLKKVASSAIAIATSQQAARGAVIEGDDFASDMTTSDIRDAFDRIKRDSTDMLDKSLSGLFSDYHHRADRAHTNFIERATHSLLGHLETHGDEHVWEYDPAGLRMLLRSAYSSMGNKARKAARETYDKTLHDIAVLLYRGFGPAVEGIQIAAPEVPQIPSPVALGQTIALDFNDRWWSMWWRRTRGYSAFAKQFRKLISAETEDFMTQMKDVQTADIRKDLVVELEHFLEEQNAILHDLIAGEHSKDGAEQLFKTTDYALQSARLETTLETLRRYAT
ncbi:dynamin family protein [Roseovarius sp. 2305UL8-3]|uniref:dynamin family protein n=1 Tax=Roseovarius conchicola TaxID=3121636 RepID=UPI0035290016